MEFQVNIHCDTAAFEGDHRLEVGRILVDAMTQIVQHDQIRAATLHDRHGKQVGMYEFLPANL